MSKKVKAVVLREIGKICIDEVEHPGSPGPGEVLIAPKTVGICGSDVHYYQHGRIGPFVLKTPMILGHEGAGVVIEVGEGVNHLKPGDRVCMEPGIPNPNSRASKEGLYNVDPGVRFWATPPVDGCLVEEILHPAPYVYKIPDNMTFAEGALIEPFAVGMQAATKAKIKPGDIAAVVGCGTIGVLSAFAALAGGASKVYVSDVAKEKLQIVANIPGIVPVDASETDLGELIRSDTGGWGPEVVFEASGALAAYRTLWELPAPGGVIVMIGMPTEPVPYDIPTAQSKELRIENVFRYANVYQKAVNLAASDQVDLSALVSETFTFEDSVAAFERCAEGRPTDTKIQIMM